MRVALSLLSGVGYGGVTYFTNLIPALAVQHGDVEYHCFVPADHPLLKTIHAHNVVFHVCMRHNRSAIKRMLWEQIVLPWKLYRSRIDIMYTAKNIAVFLAPCRVVIAIRNMEPFRYRTYTNSWRRRVMLECKRVLTGWSVHRAVAIVAVSAAVRDAVIAAWPSAAKKITVVYNGNPVAQVPSTKYQVPSGDFLLTASKFVPYANQLALVEGYARLRQQMSDAPPLWFAGGVLDDVYAAAVHRRVEELHLESHVRFLGLVPQAELHALMRSASAFIFPSTVESCPHTLIEAMACGVPIATSTTPPMPEICDTAAVYFDVHDADAIAFVVRDLLSDTTIRRQRIASGRVRAATFTWERTATGLLNVLRVVRPIRISAIREKSVNP